MDAIILCLGGLSKSTGRQAAAKTFIKTNRSESSSAFYEFGWIKGGAA